MSTEQPTAAPQPDSPSPLPGTSLPGTSDDDPVPDTRRPRYNPIADGDELLERVPPTLPIALPIASIANRTQDALSAQNAELESADPPSPATTSHRWSPRRLRTFQTIYEVPAFRWYLVAMVGNWSAMQMQMIARGFLTYQITGSFAALGAVELANTFPRLIFALTGGVVADRQNRRVIAQIGQMVSAVVAISIAILLVAGVLRFQHLVIATLIQGIANSFALPARQAMIPEIVGMSRLTNALALNVSVMSTLRLGAPAIAGVLLAVTGAASVFFLMGVLYTIATLVLFRVHVADRAETSASITAAPLAENGRKRRRGSASISQGIADIKGALVYLWGIPVLRTILIVDMFLGMLTFPYQRLLPGFVMEVLAETDEQTAIRMGILLTVAGFGALFGSLSVASLRDKHRGALVVFSVALFGIALFLFANSTVFYISIGIVFVMGIGQSMRQSLNSILIQSHTSNQFRGRISSIMLFEDGIESLGIFGIALIAAAFGPQFALSLTAIAMLVLAAVMWLALPSYRRLQ